MPKQNPYGDKRYLPTSASFKCPGCGRVVMLRQKERAVLPTRCYCGEYAIELILGLGRNNYTAYWINDKTGQKQSTRAVQFNQS